MYYTTKPINKKRQIIKKHYQRAREPQSQNEIYLQEINCLKCPYPHSAGRKKVFKNLWRLYMHCSLEHSRENYREIVMTIADLIIKKVLI